MKFTSQIRVLPPKREKKKVIVVLPVDQIKLLDDAANAIGIDRSAFLTIYIDTFAETLQSFVSGWLTGMKFYQLKVAEETRGDEVAVLDKTGKVTVRRM